jgi:hypothetical protein
MKLGIAVRYVKFSRHASSVKIGSVTALLYFRASASFCQFFPHLFSDLGEIRCINLHVTSLSKSESRVQGMQFLLTPLFIPSV